MGMCLIKLANFRHQIIPTSQTWTNFRTKRTHQMVVQEFLFSKAERSLLTHFIRHLGLCIRSDCSTHCTYQYCITKEFDSPPDTGLLFYKSSYFWSLYSFDFLETRMSSEIWEIVLLYFIILGRFIVVTCFNYLKCHA